MRHLARTLFTALLFIAGCHDPQHVPDPTPDAPPAPQWHSLFDGRTLGPWHTTDFAGTAEIEVVDGAIVIPIGHPLSGITWSGEPPFQIDYELELEARRVLGTDFFCGLTFPVGDDSCTLILGGWGGSLTGLSSLSGFDASSNSTTTFIGYEANRWYHVRLRVEKERIQTWLDGERIIDADITSHWVGIRPEVELSRPLGIATFTTEGHIRNIRWRGLVPGEGQ